MKNSKGISLIALIITIIVIIILAAIVIGGVFNTPNDAKFANFCQEYDRIQTEIRLKYYEKYQADAINVNATSVKSTEELYSEVAGHTYTGTGDNADNANTWVKITSFGSVLSAKSIGGENDHWFLRLGDGKLAYSGFQKADAEFYTTPSHYVTSGAPLATMSNANAGVAGL